MAPADDIEDADPGLARDRTELAWTRTAISFAALGGLIIKNRPFAGLPVLVLSALIWVLGRLTSTTGAGQARARHLLLITVAVTGVSITALVITLLGPEASGLRP
jgi:uncharacterized membrane protein YidH (DUF202 family)